MGGWMGGIRVLLFGSGYNHRLLDNFYGYDRTA